MWDRLTENVGEPRVGGKRRILVRPFPYWPFPDVEEATMRRAWDVVGGGKNGRLAG